MGNCSTNNYPIPIYNKSLPIAKISLPPNASYINITNNLQSTNVIYENNPYLFIKPVKPPNDSKSFKTKIDKIWEKFRIHGIYKYDIIKPCFWVNKPIGLLIEHC